MSKILAALAGGLVTLVGVLVSTCPGRITGYTFSCGATLKEYRE